jgi:dipeptidyl aminopeptidase/acylaminoacyl peptidase
VRKSGVIFLVLFSIIFIETIYIVKHITPVEKVAPKPLLTYAFANLKKTEFPKNRITFGKIIDKNDDLVSQMFYFSVPKVPGSKTMEKVSGLANIPRIPGKYPVIVMFRGYVPDEIYKPGVGTQAVAAVLAKNGYITLSPDFLGFGESASPSADSFENRFQTYTTALTLLSSLSTINSGLSSSYSGKITADLSKVGIWGHSNGGHIALSVLAIGGFAYPTVLWAPVSTSFPYSILYYTDESDDQGKALRKDLADFETKYNTDLFSPQDYYGWIKAPLEINQGTSDQEVPYWWSDNLVAILKKDNVSVNYLTYTGADHNMLPGSWSEATLNTLDFYNNEFFKQ